MFASSSKRSIADQWASINALQSLPSIGVGGLREYSHVRVSQWQWARPAPPLVSSSKTKSCRFSSVPVLRSVRPFIRIKEIETKRERRGERDNTQKQDSQAGLTTSKQNTASNFTIIGNIRVGLYVTCSGNFI